MSVPHKARRDRGLATEKIAARYWQTWVWSTATHKGGSSPGRDLLGTPGCSIEIKARRDFAPLEWLQQAEKASDLDEFPWVQWRPDGYGEATVGRWPVMARSQDFANLLRLAGYGDQSSQAKLDRIELAMLRRWARDVDRPGYEALLDNARAACEATTAG